MQYDKIAEAAADIRAKFDLLPRIGIISGTGISLPGFDLDSEQKVRYQDLEGFSATTVASHSGELIVGKSSEQNIAWFKGRYHYYEGFSMQEVAFPARVFAALGGEILIVINASGGVNPKFEAGDLAMITDHINFMQDNPLIGENDDRLGPRFPDMSQVYDLPAREALVKVADELSIKMTQGIYLALPGPSLETKAEYEMIRRMGADMVGMSTVPEVLAARHNGLRVLGISIVTNVVKPEKTLAETTIDEVIEVADQASKKLGPLLNSLVPKL